MSIKFACPGCGKELTAPDEMAGRRAKCKVCATIMTIPNASTATEDEIGLAPLDEDDPPIRVEPKPRPVSTGPVAGIPIEDDLPLADVVTPGVDYSPSTGLAPSGAGAGGVQNLQRQLQAINQMVDNRRFLEATQALKQISPQANGNPGYHYLCGMAYSGLGNHPHALDHLARAIDGGIRNPTVFAAKGKAELELGRYANAIESLDTALDLAGTDVPDYMADLAKAYDGAKMPKDAGATWAALAQINPNHPALLERERMQLEKKARRQQEQAAQAMVQMQKEQRASDTACWICIILRILLECL